ncbi:MAG: hypothetical protein RR752_03310, partial [Mucinivorans sp.]
MKNTIITLALVLLASTASAQYVDDLYGTPVKTTKRTKNTNTISNTQSAAQQASRSYSTVSNAVASVSNEELQAELVTSYDVALIRRLNAMRNATNDQPESYWQLMEQYQAMLERKYNQALYNIVVVGDQMWVEPQSITALFDGTDPAAGVIKYNNQIRQSGFGTQNTNSNQEAQQNITINVNVVDSWDRWDYNSWFNPFYGWNRPYYWGRPY